MQYIWTGHHIENDHHFEMIAILYVWIALDTLESVYLCNPLLSLSCVNEIDCGAQLLVSWPSTSPTLDFNRTPKHQGERL